MIFLKPHWTAALTAEAVELRSVTFTLSWIQGSVGDCLILQHVASLSLVAYEPENSKNERHCHLKLQASHHPGQFYVPVKNAVLLGEKLPIHQSRYTFATTLRLIEQELEAAMKCAVRGFLKDMRFLDEITGGDGVLDYMRAADPTLAQFNTSAANLSRILRVTEAFPSRASDRITYNYWGELPEGIPF